MTRRRPPPSRPARPAAVEDDGLRRVQALREGGRFVEALGLAQAHVARFPRDAAGHTELGLVHLYAGRPQAALGPFQEVLRLRPNLAVGHYNLASALEHLGREGEAITGFRRAVALDPDNVDMRERLAGLLVVFGKPVEAAKHLRRAAALTPDKPRGLMDLAAALFDEGDDGAAEARLREALGLDPGHAEAARSLATILRERGKFAEAIPLLERVAASGKDSEQASACYELALSKRVTPADQPLLDRMAAMLRSEALPLRPRWRLHLGLGKAQDDLGRYAEAMRHFDLANELMRQGKSVDRAHFAAGVERLIGSFTAEAFAGTRALGSRSELPVLILGMPRSGTSLVEQILSSHPDVGAGGELKFWHDQAEALGSRGAEDEAGQIRRLAAAYETLLHSIAPDARRVTDKMPGNFLWIGLIHRSFPAARIIHCRRHPVDTCLSNYFTAFTTPMPFANHKGDLAFYYRRYERLMAHWRASLPPECLLEIQYEALVAEPEPHIRRMIEFIGLDWNEACLSPEKNRRAVKTASQWQVRQPIYRGATERWRRYEPWLGELSELLERGHESGHADALPPRPEQVTFLLHQVAAHRAAGRLDEAARLLGQAHGMSPDDALIENEAGLIHLQRHAWPQAVESFERAIALEPDLAEAHYNLGCALERRREGGRAIVAFRRATSLSPELAEAWARLGNLLQAQAAWDEAATCFRRAAEAQPETALGRLCAAKALMASDRPAEAQAVLGDLVTRNPENGEAWKLNGVLLAEQGRFDAAGHALEQALERDPTQIAAYLDLVQTRRMGEADRPLMDRIEARLGQGDLNDLDRALLHFSLGKCFDDLEQFEPAIRHFDAANRIEHATSAFDRARFAALVDQWIATVPPEKLGAAAGCSSERPLFVLGMPRSGTTLVEQILSSHPQITGGGERRFWSEAAPAALDAEPEARVELGRRYLALLDQVDPLAARVTDKNPFNFLYIGLIRAALPGARFIHCRRSPPDVALSIYFTRFASRLDFASDRGDIVFYYRQYERLMTHWRASLPPGHLLEVEYEALVREPEPIVRRLIGFAGLGWDEACLRPERNSRLLKTASLWQARQPVYTRSIERWRRYESWLGELRDLVSGE